MTCNQFFIGTIKHSKTDEDDDVEVYHKNTLIKVQALAVYAQEEEELF